MVDTCRRPPYPAKPRSAQAMTAIAGFRCSSGVVLCADSELNYGMVKRDDAKKIRFYGNTGTPVRVALTGAGEWDEVLRIMEYIDSEWTSIHTGSDFVTKLADKVKEIYAQHPADWNNLVVLAAYWESAKRAKVSKFISSGAVPIPDFACEGMGLVLSHFLAGTLYTEGLSLRHGICLASYILYVADRFAPECGGLGDIFTLSDDGVPDFELPWDMQAMREFFERLPDALRPIILEGPDNKVSPSLYASALEICTSRLSTLRKEIELDTYERGRKYGHFD
jgi:20S proteasome alpha/beta subunit